MSCRNAKLECIYSLTFPLVIIEEYPWTSSKRNGKFWQELWDLWAENEEQRSNLHNTRGGRRRGWRTDESKPFHPLCLCVLYSQRLLRFLSVFGNFFLQKQRNTHYLWEKRKYQSCDHLFSLFRFLSMVAIFSFYSLLPITSCDVLWCSVMFFSSIFFPRIGLFLLLTPHSAILTLSPQLA